ncbi:MAG: hypothetical protein KME28_18895 [Pelatocladus maniniholoensis HA4357-MV3]|jgi:hypothetical protein|uniref:Uncharacterized protein n=1 Tax=Pelatocladus maniniholoensis HA4357-MV3 TaxID=1117104 RepID=A0A9E3LUK7_9NOST|nr:hypothetical protein [Pelatocladus maniniholoensis HA4357-MV3]
MTTRKQTSSLNQKIITLLLVLKILLVGIQAENRIQQEDASIEVLIWMINQCIPILQKTENLEDKNKK